MTGRILLKGGTLVHDGLREEADVLIGDGVIAEIGKDIPVPGDCRTIDVTGKFLTPGLVDVHVHFREPGYEHKETIATGSRAAAHGGYTCVCTMPNLNPTPDSPAGIGKEIEAIRKGAVIDVRPYAAITLGRKGERTVDVEALKDLCVAFSDDGSGVQKDGVMEESMKKIAASGRILAAHCEDDRYEGDRNEWGEIERDVEIAGRTGCTYHVCHISTRKGVEIIREAKAKGFDVSCETAPHYLLLSEDDVRDDGRFKMNPPIRTEADHRALLEGLRDGTIDMVATDHAPHTAEEKSRGFKDSAMGIVGLETAFPVLYTGLVENKVISLEKLVNVMSEAPRKRFRIGGGLAAGESADIAVFDLDGTFEIRPEEFLSKGRSTPFEGRKVRGRCLMTFYRGDLVWKL